MNTISSIINDNNFIKLQGIQVENFYLKLEALNPAGSVKIKAAVAMVNDLEKRGCIQSDTVLIESSSGSLGVALSMVCAERGYRFTCVVDPNTTQHNIRIMKILGAVIVVVDKRDENGGFLGTRIAHIKEQLATDCRYHWLNQYANPENPQAHVRSTARALAAQFSKLDYLFVGAGTTGTLMGCLQYFSQHRPETKVIAVDSIGSVTFGGEPAKRYIPGLGTSRRPEICNPEGLYAVELVPEINAISMCRYLARTNGLLSGGSTGTVVAGVHAWRDRLPLDAVVVAISPDMGERYLDTVYDDDWVRERFGVSLPLENNISWAACTI